MKNSDFPGRSGGVLRRRFHLFLLAISVLALVLRLEVLRELAGSDPKVLSPPQVTDMRTFMELSAQIYRGGFCGEFYFQPLYYALFIPSVYVLSGGVNILAVLAVQCLLGALAVWLTGLCAAMIWNRKAGLAAAALLALSRELIMYSSYYQIETLKYFLLSLLIFTAVLAYRRRSPFLWIVSGITSGLLVLARANAVVFFAATFALALLPWLRTLRSKPVRAFNRQLLFSALFSISALVAVIPFCIHNSRITGNLAGPSTAGPFNLALGSNPESPPGGSVYSATYLHWTSDGGREVGRHFRQWLADQPLAFPELFLRKLLLFWDAGEIPDNISFDGQKQFSFTLRTLGFIPTGVLITLFLSALIFLPQRIFPKTLRMYPVLAAGLYWLIMGFFFIVSRYRLAIMPVLAIFAGIFLAGAFRKYSLSSSRGRTTLAAALAVVLSFLLCHFVFDAYRLNLEKHIMRLVRPSGDRIDLDGRLMLMDHGPLGNGSWRLFSPSAGEIIEKNFALPGVVDEAELYLRIKFPKPGRILISINGEQYDIGEDVAGWKDYAFGLKKLEDGKLRIEVLDNRDGAQFAADFQRDYGRTAFNGANPSAELVARIILKGRGANPSSR